MSQTTLGLLDADLRPAVLPGVVELLTELERRGHALAPVTGTISETARQILTWAGLNHHFPAAAFGEEGDERVELLRAAVERAKAVHSLRCGSYDRVSVGDSSRDVLAAHQLGARPDGHLAGSSRATSKVQVADGCFAHPQFPLQRHRV